MAKASPIITNFASGELSDRLEGRVDIPQYFNSCRILENMLITAHGNAERTPGTALATSSKDSSKKARLIDFVKDQDNLYVCEFGDQYIRFCKDHEPIESGGSPYEIVSPYLEADLFKLKYYQILDELWIVHPSYAPRKLTTASDTSWTLASISFTAGVDEEDFSTADHYPSCLTFFEGRAIFAATNADPHTCWGSVSNDYDNFTLGTNDGDAFKYVFPTKNRILWLASKSDILAGANGDEWILSGNGAPLTPSNVSLKRQSAYGSADIQAEPVNESVFYVQKGGKRIREYSYNRDVDSYISPDLTILAEHITESGIACYALQTNPNTIFWCVRNDGVLIGLTYDRMYNVVGWHRHITDGEVESIAVIPKTDEDEIWIIVKREIDGQTKRYIEYFKSRDFGSDQADCFYVHCGLTFDGGSAKDITGATQAKPVVISSTAHGFENDQLVQITGVEGMTELNYGVYMVKNKTADTFELYMEDESDELDGTFFTAYTSAGTVQQVFKTLTGLDHLEGKTVSILGDGATQPDKTVESGEITLKYYSNKVHVGLPYTSKLKPQRLEAGSADGTSQGKTKRINRITVRYRLTNSCKIGTDEDHLEEILFREGTALMGTPTPLYSGDQEISFPGGYEKEGNIMIVQDNPLPLCIVAIMPRVRTND